MTSIFTDSVRFAMDEQDINVSELACLTGFSTTYISKILRGEKRWNETTLSKTLKALNLEIEIKPAPRGRKKVMA